MIDRKWEEKNVTEKENLINYYEEILTEIGYLMLNKTNKELSNELIAKALYNIYDTEENEIIEQLNVYENQFFLNEKDYILIRK